MEARPPTSKHTPKRTAAQRAADLLYAEKLHLRGFGHAEIASRLTADRGYSISRQQIAYDLKSLEEIYAKEVKETMQAARARELKILRLQECAAWDAWHGQISPGSKQEKIIPHGNPAYLKLLGEIHDRRVKLLGLSMPDRVEITEPPESDDGDIPPEEMDEILGEHYERMMERRKEASASAPPSLAMASS